MAILPGAPTSAISPALADGARAHGTYPDVKIHLRAESFRARINGVEASPAADASVRIGRDVLDFNPIEIDFVHHELQPLSPGEARRFERRSQPIAIRHEPDGTLSVEVAVGGQVPVRARLDLSGDLGFASPGPGPERAIRVGGVDISQVEVTSGPSPVVGLYAFRHFRVLFDLGHDRIWVRT
jgi:hypothetical protein